MRVAYVCHWDPFAQDGVVKKINAQVAAWRAAGVEAEVFCVGPAPEDPRRQTLAGRTFLYRRPIVGRARATLLLQEAVRAYHPDLVYVRYSFFVPPLIALGGVPTVVEVNSNDRREYRLRGPAAVLYNEVNRRLLLGRSRGLAFVTDELATSRDFRRFGKPSVTISNGIELDPNDPPPARNERPRVVFISGTPGPWHGLDKVEWLARNLPEIDFAIIGAGVASSPVPNLTLHPRTSPDEYEPILRSSDVALGTLALHRKGMEEAAPLKVREYLKNGLPVILAYDDPDLRDPAWFLLRIPNTETNVRDRLDDIRRFVTEVTGKCVPREAVAPRIGLAAKEARRLAFLELVGRGSRGQESAAA